jgi:hypothetical protein
MKMWGYSVGLSSQSNDPSGELHGFNRAEPNPSNSGCIRDFRKKTIQRIPRRKMHPVRSDVNTCQDDLSQTFPSQFFDLLENQFRRYAAAMPSNNRNHAIATTYVTPILDFYERPCPVPLLTGGSQVH